MNEKHLQLLAYNKNTSTNKKQIKGNGWLRSELMTLLSEEIVLCSIVCSPFRPWCSFGRAGGRVARSAQRAGHEVGHRLGDFGSCH
jgi:hypothetical protein